MKKRLPIALVVHGHFYQPPRENPWTDEVPREPSAAPFANWNARIHAECYRANAYARIYASKDRVASIVNNYASLSFNVGPTLARWIARHDAHVIRRMREGDADQQARIGAGGAMAQVWGHAIAPLLSERDRRTQILWGLQDFRRRFGRDAAGMWLPETAANPASLAALIDAGVAHTILAPEQIEAIRPPDGEWQAVTADTLDTGRAYRFLHPDGSGRSIAVGVFDGPLSRDLAFGTATRDAASFLSAMRKSADRSRVAGKPLVLAASDGELYGHHKKFADLTLAYAATISAPAEDIEVTNLAVFLAESPPTWELRLRPGPNNEGTAWSCSHGLGRWLRDCGCRMSNAKGSSQAWRAPLRRALDLLRDGSEPFFEDVAGDLFADPWQARDEYGLVIDEGPETRKRKLRSLGRPGLRRDRGESSAQALTAMEMQRSLLLMYASCAWYFDDIGGAEAAIALRRAAHAMDLWTALGGNPPRRAFLDILASARSNDRKLGNGADAFARACKERVTPERVVARWAFSSLASMASGVDQAPGFLVTTSCPPAQAAPSRDDEAGLCPAEPKRGKAWKASQGFHLRTLQGKATVTDKRNGTTTILDFRASHDGKATFECRAGKTRLGLGDLDDEATQALRLGAMVRMAAGCAEPSGCKALLAVADTLATCTASEQAALAGLLAHALATFLEARIGKAAVPQSDWRLALALADRAGAVQATDDWRRVQEIVWEDLALLARQGRAIPKPLRVLAERLELIKPQAAPAEK